MEIPVSLDYLAGPDLFFRVIKRGKSVSVGKPEKANKNTASIKTVIPQSILERPPESGSKCFGSQDPVRRKMGSRPHPDPPNVRHPKIKRQKRKLIHLRECPLNQAHPESTSRVPGRRIGKRVSAWSQPCRSKASNFSLVLAETRRNASHAYHFDPPIRFATARRFQTRIVLG